jgi:hypothetical protein
LSSSRGRLALGQLRLFFLLIGTVLVTIGNEVSLRLLRREFGWG